MVLFQAAGSNSKVTDLYSYGRYTPSVDTQQDYTFQFVNNGNTVTFVADRKLDTGDS